MIREGRLTMSMTANVKTTKRCAFCKHWYDPANSAIEPKVPRANTWIFDDHCKKMCMKKNYETSSTAFCGKYECKIDLQ